MQSGKRFLHQHRFFVVFSDIQKSIQARVRILEEDCSGLQKKAEEQEATAIEATKEVITPCVMLVQPSNAANLHVSLSFLPWFLFWVAKRHLRYDEIAAAILEIGQKNVSDDTIFYFRNYVPKRSHRLPSSMSRTFQKSWNSTRWVWKVLWISLTSQEFFWYMVVRNKRKKPWHIHG